MQYDGVHYDDERVLTGFWRKFGDRSDKDMAYMLMWADWFELPDDTMMLPAIFAGWKAGCQMDDPDSVARVKAIALRAGYGELGLSGLLEHKKSDEPSAH